MLGTQYGLGEFVGNLVNLAYTKTHFPGARLIRLPFYLRNARGLSVGNGFTLGRSCRFDLAQGKGKVLRFGENCKLNDRIHIVAHERVEIGNDVLMASDIFITDTSHGEYRGAGCEGPDIPPDNRRLVTDPVVIGDRVWIGEHVAIMPGITIGSGAIIGANSVVTHSVPSNSIVAGSPAKVVKVWDSACAEWVSCKGDKN